MTLTMAAPIPRVNSIVQYRIRNAITPISMLISIHSSLMTRVFQSNNRAMIDGSTMNKVPQQNKRTRDLSMRVSKPGGSGLGAGNILQGNCISMEASVQFVNGQGPVPITDNLFFEQRTLRRSPDRGSIQGNLIG